MTDLKVLFVTSELAGLVKTGGLGDVSAGLPLALRRLGIDVRILIPAYADILGRIGDIDWTGRLPGRALMPGCRVGATVLPDGMPIYFVAASTLFDRRGGPYCSPDGRDWPDNHLRFARLSLAAAEIASGRGGLGWVPDLVHVNDWPGGMTPAYMHWDGTRVPTVQTIHNIAYQGNFDAGLQHVLGISDEAFDLHGVEFHGRISFLKAGAYYATHVTTVSPTYAKEILTEPLGAGLHGLMRARDARGQLSGIVNGLDKTWDPAVDPHLSHHFGLGELDGKQANAEVVRAGLCLRPSDGPLFGIVSRLVHQKGLDLVAEAANAIVGNGGQIAILGLGDPDVEQLLSRTARRHRDDMGVLIGFNEQMARRIVAGSDFTLMPSRFEPCGLTQMQAQRYGALPVAHATGGLADTIEDGETGFLFPRPSSDSLMGACHRAFDAYEDRPRLEEMRRAAMARCFGWAGTARQYQELYCQLVGHPGIPLRPRTDECAEDMPVPVGSDTADSLEVAA